MSSDASYNLLLETVSFNESDQVLLFHAGSFSSAKRIAQQVAHLHVYDTDYADLRDFQDALDRDSDGLVNKITVSDGVFVDEEAVFDKVVIINPKGRDFARALLWNGQQALKSGGSLYIAGATKAGIKSIIVDAKTLLGSCRTLAYKQRVRVGVSRVKQPVVDYPSEWGAIPTHIQLMPVDTPLRSLEVGTMPGVFSWKKLDAGTQFLLEQEAVAQAARDSDVLEVGCGTGVIGGALSHLAKSVLMTDVNLLAVGCTEVTIQQNQLADIHVTVGDVYSSVQEYKFDLIISNPPFHKGFDVHTNVAHRIIREAKQVLRPGGRLILVANAFLPYDVEMRNHFREVKRLAETHQFVVLEGII